MKFAIVNFTEMKKVQINRSYLCGGDWIDFIEIRDFCSNNRLFMV